MMKYVDRVKVYYKKARGIGATEYVLSDIFQKAMVFAGGFILVRVLSKEDYGCYTYVLNIFGIFTLTGDLGISSAVLQSASVHYGDGEKRKAYIRYGGRALWAVSLLSALILLLVSFFYGFSVASGRGLFRMLFLLPLFNNEIMYFQNILRVELRNREYARINLLKTAIHYAALISLSYFAGLPGAVLSAYPVAVLVLAVYMATLKPGKFYRGRDILTKQEKRDFWKFAVLMQVNQTSLALLNYLDIYCIGITIKEPEIIAEYKVASTIPTALYFVPNSVLFFMVPIIGRKIKDGGWVRAAYRKITVLNLFSCMCIGGIFAVFSKQILTFVYGEQYAGSTSCFMILLAGFIVYGVLQSPASNILVIKEKLSAVLAASVAGALINIALNLFLLNAIGSAGAAIATAASHLFIGGVLTCYLRRVLRNS